METKKLVMFDFDGVLVNTLEYSYEIHKSKNPNFTWEKYLTFSNGNYYEGMGKAIENGHVPPTIEEYKNGYDKHIIDETIHDILRQSIIELKKFYTLTIVSSMYDDSIEKFLKKENLREYFADICGADFEKSKVKKMNHLLAKYELSPDDSVMITDSLGDIR